MTELTKVKGLLEGKVSNAIPLRLVTSATYADYQATLEKPALQWLKLHKFKPEAGRSQMMASAKGDIDHVLIGMSEKPDAWALATLPGKLPEGNYTLDLTHYPELEHDQESLSRLAFGWGQACYRFAAFKAQENGLATLVLPRETYRAARELLESAYLARDLINLPTNYLGPSDLLDHAQYVGKQFGAKIQRIDGDMLLSKNYPAVHAVGRASSNPPGLIDIRWGNPSHPKVTLVGKGVCFDTGGLDIKPSQFMKLMKKDMGGAAVTLALARLIMARELPVRLRLLIPAVENSVSANAFRPQDVLATRKGITVEIGNTDAEGRLILCDALAEADGEEPDLLIDCATLTGAARVALGTDIPAYFTNSDELAGYVDRAAKAECEHLWRLPLHTPYEEMLDSKVADINNAPDSTYAGAIAAALFLRKFVEKSKHWLHIDMMAWNVKPRPGRPVGGEAQVLRTLFRLVQEFTTRPPAVLAEAPMRLRS